MTFDEFRHEMNSYREAAQIEATSAKDSFVVLIKLRALYDSFDADERQMADRVVSEWALSDNESLRFDAIFLIRERKISSAKVALQELAIRLESSPAPGAKYELAKLRHLLAVLPT